MFQNDLTIIVQLYRKEKESQGDEKYSNNDMVVNNVLGHQLKLILY